MTGCEYRRNDLQGPLQGDRSISFFRDTVYKGCFRGTGGKGKLVMASSKQEGLIGYSTAPKLLCR